MKHLKDYISEMEINEEAPMPAKRARLGNDRGVATVEVLPKGKRAWVEVSRGDRDDMEEVMAVFNNGEPIGWGSGVYVKESLSEARRTVVLSPSEKHRKALYDLKNTLDGLDQLGNFSYTGKRGKEPARAEFDYVDQDVFDSTLREVEEKHGVNLTEG